jgi:hypothetical protein
MAMAYKHQFPHNVDQQNPNSTRRKMTPAMVGQKEIMKISDSTYEGASLCVDDF